MKTLLKEGKDVLIIGSAPFTSIPCYFKISLAGRTNGNLATVVYDHPAASYLKANILKYMKSEKFTPSVNYTENMLDKLTHGKLQNITGNVNLAFNPNDKTALVK